MSDSTAEPEAKAKPKAKSPARRSPKKAAETSAPANASAKTKTKSAPRPKKPAKSAVAASESATASVPPPPRAPEPAPAPAPAPHESPSEPREPRPASTGDQNTPSNQQPHNEQRREFRGGRRFGKNFRGRRRRHQDYDDQRPRHEGDRENDGYQDPAPPADETSPPGEPVYAEGIVEVSGKGFGFLRESRRDYVQSNNDVFVTPEVIRGHGLRDGMYIKGETRRGNRGLQLFKLTELEGKPPGEIKNLPVFEELTTINPLEQIKLETASDRYTTRVIDLMAPIGKGQRGLIVAPPRTGKTTLLQHIAEAVAELHPDIKLIVLLVDERPEEVTEMRRTLPTAELMASSNDSDIKSHTRIAQLAIERARRLVEMGHDVFVLMDSITRVGRAFNNAQASGGRTMSGGVDSRALEIPRRLFASARNTEEAGSLTIVATALIETGSRMDELIFQEFKGTGNMELVLDRKISDQRIYPAVDIFLSGTRREELLIPADALHKISVIRRGLAGHKPIEAIERLIFFLRKYPSNAEMLKNIPG